ncbi:MAG: CAP domain-containing protein [Candidatus Ornithomonoglobus sp.]
MKKIIAGLWTFIVLIHSFTAGAESIKNIYLNDTPIECTKDASGHILIPARALFEEAGFTVQWFDDERRMTAYTTDLNISIFDNASYIFVNKNIYNIEEPISIQNDSFFIPVSAAILSLDASSEYVGNSLYLTSDKMTNSEGWQYEVFYLVNDIRSQHGLHQLTWNSDLTRAARLHCEDMISRNYFAHNTPEGCTPFDRMKALGIRYSAAAENIAAGQPDPQSVVESWMSSEAHRNNILNPDLKEVGIAFVRGGTYGIYWAQEFATTK